MEYDLLKELANLAEATNKQLKALGGVKVLAKQARNLKKEVELVEKMQSMTKHHATLKETLFMVLSYQEMIESQQTFKDNLLFLMETKLRRDEVISIRKSLYSEMNTSSKMSIDDSSEKIAEILNRITEVALNPTIPYASEYVLRLIFELHLWCVKRLGLAIANMLVFGIFLPWLSQPIVDSCNEYLTENYGEIRGGLTSPLVSRTSLQSNKEPSYIEHHTEKIRIENDLKYSFEENHLKLKKFDKYLSVPSKFAKE